MGPAKTSSTGMSPAGKVARDFFQSRLRFGIRPGLERTKALLAALGDPQRRLRFAHVAGTNGKGSVCACLASALQAAGYRTGLYTSPHLMDYPERIRVDGVPIDDGSLARAVDEIRVIVQAFPQDLQPTEFEVLTAVALLYFTRARVDVVVWETGLGGRLDATNVVFPEVAVITNVDLDHTDVLGKRVEQIAYDKAGIIKSGVPVVTGAAGPALAVIEQAAAERCAPLRRMGADFFGVSEGAHGLSGQRMTYLGAVRDLPGLWLRMSGRYQVANAAVALAALECMRETGWDLPDASIRSGLAGAFWPGRFDVWQMAGKTRLVLDGAHNPAGARALAESLREAGVSEYDLVLGIFKDKDVRGIVEHLAKGPARRVWATAPRSPRAADPGVLARLLADDADSTAIVRQAATVEDALAQAVDEAEHETGRVIVVAGSLTTAGEALAWLGERPDAKRAGERDAVRSPVTE